MRYHLGHGVRHTYFRYSPSSQDKSAHNIQVDVEMQGVPEESNPSTHQQTSLSLGDDDNRDNDKEGDKDSDYYEDDEDSDDEDSDDKNSDDEDYDDDEVSSEDQNEFSDDDEREEMYS